MVYTVHLGGKIKPFIVILLCIIPFKTFADDPLGFNNIISLHYVLELYKDLDDSGERYNRESQRLYSNKPEANVTELADRFYSDLLGNDGKVIYLDLRLVPPLIKLGAVDESRDTSSLDKGYSITLPSTLDSFRSTVTGCGSGYDGGQGLLDTFEVFGIVSISHPDHFHKSAEILVGNTRDFPFQSLRCESSLNYEASPLAVRGYFVVERYELPTLEAFKLFPFNPT